MKKFFVFLLAVLFIAASGCNKNRIGDLASSENSVAFGTSEVLGSQQESEISGNELFETESRANSAGGSVTSSVPKPSGASDLQNPSDKNPTTSSGSQHVKLPLNVEWITKPTLEYFSIRPTYDGKGWLALKDLNLEHFGDYHSAGDYEVQLIDQSGKVLLKFDNQNSMYDIICEEIPDRIVVFKDDKFALYDTSGKVILPFQDNVIFFFNGMLLMEKKDFTHMKLDKNGKQTENYNGNVFPGGRGDPELIYEKQSGSLYETWIDDKENNIFYIGDKMNSSSQAVAYVGETLKNYSEYSQYYKIPEPFYGMGVIVNGKLASEKFFDKLSLVKLGKDHSRNLYGAFAGEKCGLVNTAGVTVYPFEFEDMAANNACSAAAVQKNGKWGFVKIPVL